LDDLESLAPDIPFIEARCAMFGPGPHRWYLVGGGHVHVRRRYRLMANRVAKLLLADEAVRSTLPKEILSIDHPLSRLCELIRDYSGRAIRMKSYNDKVLGRYVEAVIPQFVTYMSLICDAYERQAMCNGREKPTTASKPIRKIELSGKVLEVDGKSYSLKPNAVTLWERWKETGGEPLVGADFPSLQISKVIKEMPDRVKRLIKKGIPHHGPSVPRLQRLHR
jgi:hypothetical protein